FFVFDQFPRGFHRAEDRPFVVARRRLRLFCFDLDAHRFNTLALRYGRQIFFRFVTGSFAPITSSQPGATRIFPSVLNGSPSTRVIRVVFSYCAGGKNTATKRLVTMSKSARSWSSSDRGAVPVGIIAK